MTMVGRPASVSAATLAPEAAARVTQATFEVVQKKPEADPLVYEKSLPMELVPYQERTDKYRSIGTAFAIAPNQFVTASHVLGVANGSQFGPPALRDAAGHVYAIDRVLKWSTAEDYAVFSVANPPKVTPLAIHARPALNSTVFAVGNALGEGVVMRDGLYTSDTPEERDGRWKWLRFSAAASPGNSGGPLVDRQGAALGVVLRKSPNENLNYAVSIEQVRDGSERSAVLEARSKFSFPVAQATTVMNFDEHIPLPQPLAAFYAESRARLLAATARTLTGYLADHREELFPLGKNSRQLLSVTYTADFPRMVRQRADGIWEAVAPKFETAQLDDNGYIEFESASSGGGFRLHRPNSLSLQALAGDSKQLMDLLLKAVVLRRPVGSDAVRVLSLGPAVSDTGYTDRWGRPWQIRSWLVPYNDAVAVTIALPTPDGYIGLYAFAPTGAQELYLLLAKSLLDFVYISYDGTLAQWRDFLAANIERPRVFSSIGITFTEGKEFEFKSARFGFKTNQAVVPITADNQLSVRFNFIDDGGDKVLWDVAGIEWAESSRRAERIDIWRQVRPDPSLPESRQSAWDRVANEHAPFNSVVSTANGRWQLAKTVDAKTLRDRQLPVGYTITVDSDTNKRQGELSFVLGWAERGFFNHEQ
jgi:hypothetical protein